MENLDPFSLFYFKMQSCTLILTCQGYITSYFLCYVSLLIAKHDATRFPSLLYSSSPRTLLCHLKIFFVLGA